MSRILKSNDTVITQHYGNNGHKGVDVVGAGHTTCPVLAHSAGTVEMIATGHGNNTRATGDASYGNFVKIKHTNGYSTLYAHLERVSVSKGQSVSKWQEIGYMGNTGRSFGAHLHFEVRKNGTYASIINPEPFINADLPGLSTTAPSNGVICNSIVGEWQSIMNSVYGCGLAVDNSFGPVSQKVASKYQLFWKQKQIHNNYVKWVQHRLNLLGFKGKYGQALAEDGYFGENTDWAVHEYQKARNITADGYVGLNTVTWLLKDKY